MAFTFSIETMVRGYHIYKEIWNAVMDGTELLCERESGHAHDPFGLSTVNLEISFDNIELLPLCHILLLTFLYDTSGQV